MIEVVVKPEMEEALEAWKHSYEWITEEEYDNFYTDIDAADQQLLLEIENGFVIRDEDTGLVRAATFIEFQRFWMNEMEDYI